jgi:elongation factor P hydroxylase
MKNAIRLKVQALLEEASIQVSWTFLGEVDLGHGWQCYRYQVKVLNTCTSQEFQTEYVRGASHPIAASSTPWRDVSNELPEPSIARVVHALISGNPTANMDFNTWCDKFDRPRDQSQSVNMYQRCVEQKQGLQRVLGCTLISKLQELF